MWKAALIFVCCLVTYLLLSQYIEEYTLQDDPKLIEIKEKIAPLFSKNIQYTGILDVINKRNVLDEISFYKGNKSYTINKEKVFLCLKKKDGEYYDMNILVFVTLHELSHVLSTTIGHDKNFNNIFDALLKKAAEMGIYDPSIPIDKNYCLDK
jgi:hypothetical protein